METQILKYNLTRFVPRTMSMLVENGTVKELVVIIQMQLWRQEV